MRECRIQQDVSANLAVGTMRTVEFPFRTVICEIYEKSLLEVIV
jgi:hypothetical protein